MSINYILDRNPYLFDSSYNKIFFNKILELHNLHFKNSNFYKNIVLNLGVKSEKIKHLNQIPMIPVNVFKNFDLYSVPKNDIVKTMYSSGTTGSSFSKINLDKETLVNQTKVLSSLFKSKFGGSRFPMIIVDKKSTIIDKNSYTARKAGILGFSFFSTKKFFLLNENYEIDLEGLENFLHENRNQKIFIYGFTFVLWKYFINELIKKKISYNFENCFIVHGGGWKKLIDINITGKKFKQIIFDQLKIVNIYDYYGMIEQTGSIYFECSSGYLHTSIYNDILIRNMKDLNVQKNNEIGIIQTFSILPKSYPGFSLLTEDLGVIIGENNCSCGLSGKYFKVLGRLEKSEIRGCSDTLEL